MFKGTATEQVIEERANAVRMIVVGSLLADYGARLIIDDTMHDLKTRARRVMTAVQSIERHFIHHPNTDTRYREVFKREFISNSIPLMAELLQTVWGLSEESMEDIITKIKNAKEEESPEDTGL